jgi:putative inorganic carbon (HCO3(-)) transporter
MSIRAVLLLAGLLPCVPICFFRPFFGVIMWTIVSFASPQWYAWGASMYFPTAELIAIPTILGFVVYGRGWQRLLSRECILIVLLWGWFTFTSLIAANVPLFEMHIDAMWARWEFVTKVLLMTLVTTAIVDSFARLRTLVIVTAACFSFYVVKALPFIIMTGGAFRLYGPPKSMVEDNNDLGLALNMTLPLVFFLAQSESNPKVKRLFWFLFGSLILGIFSTYSRGAIVGLVAVMGVIFMKVKQRYILVPVMLLAIVVAVIFAPEKWQERMNLTNKDTALDQSAWSRINAWTFSWNLAKDYPITGGGFETFTRDLFDRYAPNTKDVHGPHSVYFGLMAEHGFVGLALYLSLVLSCFASARKVAKVARYYGDEVAATYATMFQLSLVGFLVCGFFLGRAYFDYYFAVVCFIVVLKDVCFRKWREMEQQPEIAEAAA